MLDDNVVVGGFLDFGELEIRLGRRGRGSIKAQKKGEKKPQPSLVKRVNFTTGSNSTICFQTTPKSRLDVFKR